RSELALQPAHVETVGFAVHVTRHDENSEPTRSTRRAFGTRGHQEETRVDHAAEPLLAVQTPSIGFLARSHRIRTDVRAALDLGQELRRMNALVVVAIEEPGQVLALLFFGSHLLNQLDQAGRAGQWTEVSDLADLRELVQERELKRFTTGRCVIAEHARLPNQTPGFVIA